MRYLVLALVLWASTAQAHAPVGKGHYAPAHGYGTTAQNQGHTASACCSANLGGSPSAGF